MAACSLYQLFSDTKLTVGDYVAVNGPWDKFGVVREINPSPDTTKGKYLNLIRGVPARAGEKPVHQF